ncbi:MAG: hypothetical protein ACRCTQ_05240 [Brevinemataceae bacterium]
MEKIILPKSCYPSRSLFKNKIFISSKIAISRNIDALMFPDHLSSHEKHIISQEIQKIISLINDSSIITYNLSSFDSETKKTILSNILIYNEDNVENIFFAKKNADWILIPNYKDHLHFFSIDFQCSLKEIYKRLESIVIEFDKHIHFAFSEELGFLTSQLYNTGNGLSLSILVNLAGLELQGKIHHITQTSKETGYTIIPWSFSANSKLFLLQNTTSFGISETEQLQQLLKFLDRLQNSELQARTEILNSPGNLELFAAQVIETTSKQELSYDDILEFIALIDMLDKKLYKINNKEQWYKYIFTLRNPVSQTIQSSDENNQDYFRAKQICQAFYELVIPR